MKTLFTKSEILSKRGCYERQEVEKLSFINNREITIKNILESEIPFKDKRWFVWNACDLILDEKKELALNLAWCALPIYENKYPNDNRVKDCLQAIEDFQAGKITVEVLKEKRAAAYAAATTAYAADTDYASYAAAAYSAVYAADAAAAAYDAAVATYADAADAAVDAMLRYKQKIQQVLIDFVN